MQDGVDEPPRVMGVHPTTSKTSILALHPQRNTFWIIGAYTDPGGLTVPTRALSSDLGHVAYAALKSPRTLEGQTQCTCLLPFFVHFQAGHLDEPSDFSFPKKMFCGTPTMTGNPLPLGVAQRITHAPSLLTKDRATSGHLSPEQVAQLGDVAP